MSERAIFAWKKKLREMGNLEKVPLNRKYRKLDPEKLVKYVEEHPDAHQGEMASEFKVSKSCIGKVLRKLKIAVKKTRAYKERDEKEGADYEKGNVPSTKILHLFPSHLDAIQYAFLE